MRYALVSIGDTMAEVDGADKGAQEDVAVWRRPSPPTLGMTFDT
jgi:hypothetical protein